MANLLPTRGHLVLVELAGAAVLGGIALGGGYRLAGVVVGAVLLALAVVVLHRRWGYQLLRSRVGLLARRRAVQPRSAGLAGLIGAYRVESVPGGRRGTATPGGSVNGDPRVAIGRAAPTIGVVRTGDSTTTAWTVPLVLLGDGPEIPAQLLAGLLRVEDVPVSAVRLVTVLHPGALRRAAHETQPGTAAATARYCTLTVDARRAAAAIAARGGDERAVQQILRRCAVAAEQVLAAAGVAARRLDEVAVAGLFASWLGPASQNAGRRSAQTVETWSDVRVAGTWASSATVDGEGAALEQRVQRLAATAPTPMAVTALVLQPSGRPGRALATAVLRLSAPDVAATPEALAALGRHAPELDLAVRPAGGEQVPLLRATLPVDVGSLADWATRVEAPGAGQLTAPRTAP